MLWDVLSINHLLSNGTWLFTGLWSIGGIQSWIYDITTVSVLFHLAMDWHFEHSVILGSSQHWMCGRSKSFVCHVDKSFLDGRVWVDIGGLAARSTIASKYIELGQKSIKVAFGLLIWILVGPMSEGFSGNVIIHACFHSGILFH